MTAAAAMRHVPDGFDADRVWMHGESYGGLVERVGARSDLWPLWVVDRVPLRGGRRAVGV